MKHLLGSLLLFCTAANYLGAVNWEDYSEVAAYLRDKPDKHELEHNASQITKTLLAEGTRRLKIAFAGKDPADAFYSYYKTHLFYINAVIHLVSQEEQFRRWGFADNALKVLQGSGFAIKRPTNPQIFKRAPKYPDLIRLPKSYHILLQFVLLWSIEDLQAEREEKYLSASIVKSTSYSQEMFYNGIERFITFYEKANKAPIEIGLLQQIKDIFAEAATTSFQSVDPASTVQAAPPIPKKDLLEEYAAHQQCLLKYQEQEERTLGFLLEESKQTCLADYGVTTHQLELLEEKAQELLDNYDFIINKQPIEPQTRERDNLAHYILMVRKVFEALRDVYNEQVNLLAYCRASAFITPVRLGNQPKLWDKTLVHVLGDPFAEQTGLEGLIADEARQLMQMREDILTHVGTSLSNADGQKTYIQDPLQANPCHQIEGLNQLTKTSVPTKDPDPKDLERTVTKSQAARALVTPLGKLENLGKQPAAATITQAWSTFHETFLQQITNLEKKEDYIYLPMSWSGHAIIIEYVFEGNDSYTVRIYNSGEGIKDYHFIVQSGTAMRSLPYAEKQNVSKANLISPISTRVLAEVYLLGKDAKSYSTPADIYRSYFDGVLDGKRTTRQLGFGDFVDPQQGGTCAYFIHGHHDRQHRPENEANLLNFLIKLNVLKSYLDTQENRIIQSEAADDPQDWTAPAVIIQKAVKTFANDAARLYQRQGIDLGSIQVFVQQVEHKYNLLLNRRNAYLRQKKSLELRQTPVLKDIQLAKKFPKQLSTERLLAPSMIPLSDIVGPDPITTVENASAILSMLQTRFEELKEGNEWIFVKDLDEQVGQWYGQQVESFIAKLPLTLKLDPSQLSWLARSYVLNLRHLRAGLGESFTPRDIEAHSLLAMIKLLAVMQVSIEGTKPEIPSLYQHLFDSFLLESNAVIADLSTVWAEELVEIQEYWKRHQTDPYGSLRDNRPSVLVRDFFGFDRLPAVGSKSARLLFPTKATYSKYEQKHPEPQRHWSFRYSALASNELQEHWSDIRWLQKHLKKSLVEAVDLFSNDPDSQIPEHFKAAFDVSVLTNLLLTGEISQFAKFDVTKHLHLPEKTAHEQGFLIASSFSKKKIPKKYGRTDKLQVQLEGEDIFIPGAEIVRHLEKADYLRGIFLREKNPYQKPLKMPRSPIQRVHKVFVKKHVSSEQSIQLAPPEPKKAAKKQKPYDERDETPGFEIYRELMHITTSRTLQVHTTLDFFIKRPYLLEQPQYMYQFRTLLFEGNLLRDELTNPKSTFGKKLSHFLSEQIRSKKTEERFKLALDLLEIYIEAHEKETITTIFKDRFDLLSHFAAIRAIKDDPRLRAFLSLLTMRAYDIERDPTFWQNLQNRQNYYVALFEYSLFGKTLQAKMPSKVSHAGRIALRIYGKLLSKVLAAEALTAELNKSVGQVVVSFEGKCTWQQEESSPRFVCGTTTVNLASGDVFVTGEKLLPFSLEITTNKDFQLRFHPKTAPTKFSMTGYFNIPVSSNEMKSLLSRDAVLWVFQDADGRYAMITKNRDGKLLFFKRWTTQWYYLQSAAFQSPHLFFQRLDEWVSVGKELFKLPSSDTAIDIYKAREALPETGIVKEKEILAFEPGGPLRFVGRGKSDYITDDTLRPAGVTMSKYGQVWQGWIKQVEPLKEGEEQYTLSDITVVRRGKAKTSRLTSFEHPDFISYWHRKGEKDPFRITLERFKIELKRQESGDFTFPALGNAILTDEPVPGFELLPFGLVLKKGGNQVVLFPNFELSRLPDKTHPTPISYQFATDSKTSELKDQKFFQYSLIEGQLDAQNLEERLYLASLHAFSFKYERALSLIRGTGSELGTYSPEELVQVKRLIFAKNRDQGPEIDAVRLVAAAAYLRNAARNFYTAQFDTAEKEILEELFERALSRRDFIGEMWLKKDEELALLRGGYASDSIKLARLAELQELAIPLVLAHAPKKLKTFNSMSYTVTNAIVEALKNKIEPGERFMDCKALANNNGLLAVHEGIYQYHKSANTEPIQEFLRTIPFLQDKIQASNPILLLRQYLALCMHSEQKEVRLLGFFLNSFLEQTLHEYSLTTKAFEQEFKSNIDSLGYITSTFSKSSVRDAIKSMRVQEQVRPDLTVSGTPQTNLPWEKIHAQEGQSYRMQGQLNLSIPNDANQYLLKKPLLGKLQAEKMFLKTTVASAVLPALLTKYSKQLSENNASDSVVQEALKRRAAITIEKAQALHKTPRYKFNDGEEANQTTAYQLDQLAHRLREKIAATTENILDLRLSIEVRLDQEPATLFARNLEAAYSLGRSVQDLSLPELERAIGTWFYDDTLTVRPGVADALSEGKIISDTIQLMMAKAYRGHCQYILTKIAQVKESKTHGAILDFLEVVSRVRAYNILTRPDFLAFEASRKVLIRQDQIKILEDLKPQATDSSSGGHLKEQIMGSGKTFLILPLAALQNTTEKNISVVVLPRSLLPSVVQDLDKTMFESFGRQVQVIFPSSAQREGNKPLTANDLEMILSMLSEAQADGSVVVTSNEGIQSFFLSFIGRLEMKGSSLSSQALILSLYQRIFQLLKTHARVIVDEVDMIFDVLKSHQVGLGAPIGLDPHLVEASIALYRLIHTDSEMKDLVNLPFQANQTAASFTQKHYQEKIKPYLIEQILEKENFFADPATQDLWASLVRTKKGNLNEYLQNADEEAEENTQFFASIEAKDKQQKKLKSLLATLFEQVNFALPLTLGRFLKIHYGPAPSDMKFGAERRIFHIAIPYDNGSPLRSSRFASELEAVNYAIQMHLENMDFEQLLEEAFTRLRAAYETASVKAAKARIKKRYINLLNGFKSSPSIEHPQAELVQIANKAKENPETIFYLIKTYVLRQILTFPTRIHTNAQLYSQLFHTVQGMSGTLWNYHTFPRVYDPSNVQVSDTKARTLLLLTKGAADELVAELDINSESSLNDRLEALLAIKTCEACSVIDTGLFRGFENELIAERILKRQSLPQDHGVLFYNLFNKIRVFTESGTKSLDELTDAEGTSQLKLLAYWDIQHTVGADFKLAPKAKAVMFVKSHMIMRDLLQAVWRLRGLDKGQSVSLAVTKDEKAVMEQVVRGQLNLDHFAIETIADVFLYLEVNEVLRLTRLLNYRGFKQMLDGELSAKAFSQLSSKAHTASLADSYRLLRSLFVDELAKDLFARLGKPRPLLEKERVMTADMTKTVATMNKLFPSEDLTASASDTLSLRLQELKKFMLAHIQTRIRAPSAYGSAVEITEDQEQEEEEEEDELQLQQQNVLDYLKKEYKQIPRVLWNKAQAFKPDCYMSKLAPEIFNTANLSFVAAEINLGPCPVIPLSQALEIRKKPEHTIYAPDLLTSLNYTPVFLDNEGQPTVFEFYSPYHKNNTHHLVIQTGTILKVVLLDAEEAEDFFTLVQVQQTPEPTDAQVALMSNKTGLVMATEGFDSTTLEASTKYKELRMQIRFFSGEVEYKDEEYDLLSTWMTQHGTFDFIQYFTRNILSYRDESQSNYPESSLRYFLEKKATEATFVDDDEEDVEDDE